MTTVALIDWSHLVEDFLDHLGLSLDQFRTELTGGWMFGYLAAIRRAGGEAVLVTFSARVRTPVRATHAPTGAPLRILPAPAPYRWLRRRIPNPYATDLEQAAGTVGALARPATATLHALAPYLATPLWRLARELRRDRCDVILCQEYEHARFDACIALGALLRLPVFATFQGGDWQLSPLERPLRPRTIRRAAGLIVPTAAEEARVRDRYRLPAARIHRIFNPIDLDQQPGSGREAARTTLGIPTDARVVAWHGRVEIERKGLDLLATAWGNVRAAAGSEDWRLLLVGTGRDETRLRERFGAAWAGVTWVDRYVTDRAELRQLLAAADVYVFPSRREGLPAAPVEAMAAGLPVVAAAASGIPEIFAEGEGSGGVLVPVGDPGALAAALVRLLRDPADAGRLGRRARAAAEAHHGLPAVGAQLLHLFTSARASQ